LIIIKADVFVAKRGWIDAQIQMVVSSLSQHSMIVYKRVYVEDLETCTTLSNAHM